MILSALLASMEKLPPEAPLVFATDHKQINAGYHLTEVKFADVTAMDCAAQTDQWTETTLQLLDGHGGAYMPAGKFCGILAKCSDHIKGAADSIVRAEFAHNNEGMRLYELSEPKLLTGQATIRLKPLRALCKPAARISNHSPHPRENTQTKCCDQPGESASRTCCANGASV